MVPLLLSTWEILDLISGIKKTLWLWVGYFTPWFRRLARATLSLNTTKDIWDTLSETYSKRAKLGRLVGVSMVDLLLEDEVVVQALRVAVVAILVLIILQWSSLLLQALSLWPYLPLRLSCFATWCLDWILLLVPHRLLPAQVIPSQWVHLCLILFFSSYILPIQALTKLR